MATPNQRHIKTKVSGVTFDHRQDAIKAHGKRGRKIILVPEPENPVNPEAVAVYLERPRTLQKNLHYHIGYLNNKRAAEVQEAWAQSKIVSARVTEITGGTKDKPTCGVNIEIEIHPPK